MTEPLSAPAITPENVESLLRARFLQVAMKSGRWWDIRANGARKTWKTRPGEFRLPFKAGFKSCGAITESFFIGGVIRPDWFRINPDRVEMAREFLRVAQ